MGELLEPGRPVGDRYVVEGLVGSGGIAEVYRVRHVELGSAYALKVLTLRKKGLHERFLKEGQFQSQLRHPNVVTVHDILRFDGQVALVMDYVDGTTLEQLLAEVGSLPAQDAFALFVPVLAAIAAAHDKQVWHRDLKPANILLARTPVGWVPKIVDFGIAKFMQEEMGQGSTQTGMAMGTPGYMAPEQVRDSSSIDGRADIFALGAILYEMLTGRKAFADANGQLSVVSTLDREPAPLDLPEVSPEVAAAIARSMARDREARFPDCRTFARALGIGAHPLLVDMPDGSAIVASFDAAAARSLLTPSISIPPPAKAQSTVSVPTGGWLMVPFAAGTAAFVGAGVLLLVAALVFLAVRLRWEPGATSTTPPISASSIKPPAPVEAKPAPEAPVAAAVPASVEDIPVVTAEVPVPAAVAPAAPVVAPAAAPVPDPVPDDAVAEVEIPTPTPAPVVPAPVVPAPVAAPVVAPAAAPAPAPGPSFDPMTVLSGKWAGKDGDRSFDLVFLGVEEGLIKADVTYPVGLQVSHRYYFGTYDRASGKLSMRSDDDRFRIDAVVGGGAIVGTQTAGSRSSEWVARRP